MKKIALPIFAALLAAVTIAPVAGLVLGLAAFVRHWGGFTCAAYFWVFDLMAAKK